MKFDLLKKWNLLELCTIVYSRVKYKDSAVGKNMCIRKRIRPIIQKYCGRDLYFNVQKNDKMIVWMLWWQGEENMSPMIKMCYQSILKCFEGIADVRLLTELNIDEYVSLPDYIEEKRRNGIITLTHYSDIVRFHLLNKYGGLWIDATYYAANRVSQDIIDSQLYTIRIPHPEEKANNDYIWYDWAGNFIKLPAGSTVGMFVEEAFLYYWKTNNVLLEYYFIDHLLRIAYDTIPGVKEEIQKCGYNNISTHKLLPLLNQAADNEQYNCIVEDTNFFKLTTKSNYDQITESGEETLFARLYRTQNMVK